MRKIVRGHTKDLLEKAKECCLLAVDVYNKPKTSFRSGAFIVFMNIAYTSLFHAIFKYNKINYYYRDKKTPRLYEKIDGEKKAWELKECVKNYFKDKEDNSDNLAIRTNIEFFIPLRNKIEHRFMPELDVEIFGECQALLCNFERILVDEFGKKNCINENLVYSLQFSNNTHKKSKKKSDFSKVKNFISKYKMNIPPEIFSNPQYRIQTYLIQTSNPNKADLAAKFIQLDKLSEEKQKSFNSLVGITTEKTRSVSDAGNFKAGEIANYVKKELSSHYGCEINFNTTDHSRCTTKYKVRNIGNNKKNTNTEFCIYNDTHNAYSYTDKWKKYLIKKLKKEEELLAIAPRFKKNLRGLLTPHEVIKEVKIKIKYDIKLTVSEHNKYAIDYKIRPPNNTKNPMPNENYCIHLRNNEYLYNKKWVTWLADKIFNDKIKELSYN